MLPTSLQRNAAAKGERGYRAYLRWVLARQDPPTAARERQSMIARERKQAGGARKTPRGGRQHELGGALERLGTMGVDGERDAVLAPATALCQS